MVWAGWQTQRKAHVADGMLVEPRGPAPWRLTSQMRVQKSVRTFSKPTATCVCATHKAVSGAVNQRGTKTVYGHFTWLVCTGFQSIALQGRRWRGTNSFRTPAVAAAAETPEAVACEQRLVTQHSVARSGRNTVLVDPNDVSSMTPLASPTPKCSGYLGSALHAKHCNVAMPARDEEGCRRCMAGVWFVKPLALALQCWHSQCETSFAAWWCLVAFHLNNTTSTSTSTTTCHTHTIYAALRS